jgi:hypothetical protein
MERSQTDYTVEVTGERLPLQIGESLTVTGNPETPWNGKALTLRLDGVARIGEPARYVATFSLWEKNGGQIAVDKFTENTQINFRYQGIQIIKEKITLDKINERMDENVTIYSVEVTAEKLTLRIDESITVTGNPQTPWEGKPLTLKFSGGARIGEPPVYVAIFGLWEKNGSQIAVDQFNENTQIIFRHQGTKIIKEKITLDKIISR